MIAPEMTTPYQPSSTSCTPRANGRSWLEPAAAIQIGKARFPPDSAVRAYTVRGGFGASRDRRGAASDSPIRVEFPRQRMSVIEA
jgi:hypothetical protein